MRPAPRRELFAYSVEELAYQVRGLFVAVSLGQGGVAGDIGEQEGGARRVRRRCERPALLIVQLRTCHRVSGGSGGDGQPVIRPPQERGPAAMRLRLWCRRDRQAACTSTRRMRTP